MDSSSAATTTGWSTRLADLLPGAGPLAERYRRWRDSMLVPVGRIERTVAAVIAEARTQTRQLVDLRSRTAWRWSGAPSRAGGRRSTRR